MALSSGAMETECGSHRSHAMAERRERLAKEEEEQRRREEDSSRLRELQLLNSGQSTRVRRPCRGAMV